MTMGTQDLYNALKSDREYIRAQDARIAQLESDNATLRAEHTATYMAGVAEGKAKVEKLVRAAYFEGYEDAHYRETALDPDDARMRADWNESICESALRSDDVAREALTIWPDTEATK